MIDEKVILGLTLHAKFDELVEEFLKIVNFENIGTIDIKLIAIHDISESEEVTKLVEDMLGAEIIPLEGAKKWIEEDAYRKVTIREERNY